MSVYKLIWDDFCSCFLEVVKPAYQKPIDGKTYCEIVDLFETLMKILHPFMPFITEELWHSLRERQENESIMLTSMPEVGPADHQLLAEFADARKVIEQVRRVRNEKNIAQKTCTKIKRLRRSVIFQTRV